MRSPSDEQPVVAGSAAFEARLCVAGPDEPFSDAEIVGLPDPVRRYLRTAISPGTPLATYARLQIRGRIKVGRWLPFRARQVLNPHRGFIWAARAAGVIVGSDRYLDGVGPMDWKLAGPVAVAHDAGPDVSRSAAGRGVQLTSMSPRASDWERHPLRSTSLLIRRA